MCLLDALCSKVYEAPAVKRVFMTKHQAIGYAENRASFRSAEICVLDSTGKIERTVQFTEANRQLWPFVMAAFGLQTDNETTRCGWPW
jgi:hypothetical protein